MALSIFALSSEKQFKTLPTERYLSFDSDWYGNTAVLGPQFSVCFTKHSLFFCVQFPQLAVPTIDTSGIFKEGLWNGDVAELFIVDDQATSYQEFNLSPDGAWWTCCFDSPRKRASCDISEITQNVSVEHVGGSNTLCLIIPRDALKVSCSFTPRSRMNVCAIQGDDPRAYFSVANLPGQRPDFHQPESFESVNVVGI